MSKRYINVVLNEKNIKKTLDFTSQNGKSFQKVLISFPKLGLLSIGKSQTYPFKDKNSKESTSKKLNIILGEDSEYTFFTKEKNPQTGKLEESIKVKTGTEIMNFYQTKWEESKASPKDSKDKVFVSTYVSEQKQSKTLNSKELEKKLSEHIQQEETTAKQTNSYKK